MTRTVSRCTSSAPCPRSNGSTWSRIASARSSLDAANRRFTRGTMLLLSGRSCLVGLSRLYQVITVETEDDLTAADGPDNIGINIGDCIVRHLECEHLSGRGPVVFAELFEIICDLTGESGSRLHDCSALVAAD